MTKLLHGNRIAKNVPIRVGCSAAIFDSSRERILLICRSDNGLWCLPAGGVESGESVREACEREVEEETGYRVKVKRIIGVYSTPHRIIEYPDGNRFQMVAIHFEADIIDDGFQVGDETTDLGFFNLEEMESLTIMEHCWERIQDSFSKEPGPFIR